MKISNLKFGELQLIESGNKYGPMSYDYLYYKKNTPEKHRRAEFMANRMNLGAKYGFCGRHMFIVNSNPTTGDYLTITKKIVEDNFTGFPDAPTNDILLITSDTPDVVIGGLHKEMPILIAYDTKERILGAINCPEEAIDKEIPSKLIDVLTKQGSKEENIYTYISSSTEDIPFVEEPEWLQSSIWDDFIDVDSRCIYHVYPKAVLKQSLLNRGINNIETSPVNILYDYGYFYGDEGGYNFTGGFIMSKDNVKRLGSKR